MTYGEWCPKCGAAIVSVTRGIPSMGTCSNKHVTDRRDTLRREPQNPMAMELAALRQQLADAKAAQALVVERAEEVARIRAEQHANMALNGLPGNARLREAMEAAFTDMRWAIRALADPTGVEALAKLRAERDEARLKLADKEQIYTSAIEQWATRTESAEAEVSNLRDHLAAANAALEAQVARLVGAAEDAEYDLLQWLECSKSLIAAGFNMDGTAEVTAKLTAAISHIKRGKTNG